MGSLSSFNGGVKYLLCVIDIFTKYAYVKHLKDKIAKIVLHGFAEITNKSNRKPNKLLIHQGREFHSTLMQKWLDDNDILINLINIEDKSVVAERFIKTL